MPGCRKDRHTISPINLKMFSRVVQRRKVGNTFTQCGIDHISRIANVDEPSVSAMLKPSFSLAGVRTRRFGSRHLFGQGNIGDLPWDNAWETTDIKDVDVTIRGVNDIHFLF